MTISNYDFVIRRNMEGKYSTRPVGRFWELVPAARKENKISGSDVQWGPDITVLMGLDVFDHRRGGLLL